MLVDAVAAAVLAFGRMSSDLQPGSESWAGLAEAVSEVAVAEVAEAAEAAAGAVVAAV